jgi:hypothetical protein
MELDLSSLNGVNGLQELRREIRRVVADRSWERSPPEDRHTALEALLAAFADEEHPIMNDPAIIELGEFLQRQEDAFDRADGEASEILFAQSTESRLIEAARTVLKAHFLKK